MDHPALPLANSPPARRRGRPPGSRNKGSLELGKYLAARFDGLTPGQQLAELALPTPAEVRRAKRDAQELGIKDLGLPDRQLAVVVKAQRLASALGITRAEAWAAMQKGLMELMRYIHQAQPQAAEPKGGQPAATVFMIPDGAPQDSGSIGDLPEATPLDLIEDFSPARAQVAQPRSHDEG